MARADDSRLAGAAVAGAALVAYWGPAVAVGLAPVRRALRVRDRLDDRGAVALTFDDGPHPSGTPAALEALAAAGARATFFLVGEQVERFPALAAELAAAGHEVALHCHRHRSPLRLTPRQLADDLRRAVEAIGAATGAAPRLYRPPGGYLTAAALRHARREGREVVLWARAGRDWAAGATAASIARRATRRLRGGEVLLLHDADWYAAAGSWRPTAEAIPLVLARLERRGLRPALVPQGPP